MAHRSECRSSVAALNSFQKQSLIGPNLKRIMRLLDYAANVYSQNGEDGILSKILELLPAKDEWCVEFGAWDGRYLSNTCNLIEKSGYSAVLIEPDRKKFADLLKHHGNNRNVIA